MKTLSRSLTRSAPWRDASRVSGRSRSVSTFFVSAPAAPSPRVLRFAPEPAPERLCGNDINRGARASELCLITTHQDADALATYQADAIHGEVKRLIGERTTSVTVVDFET